jgi:hypothetical protein
MSTNNLPTETVQCEICTDHLSKDDCTMIDNIGWVCADCQNKIHHDGL